MNDHLQGFTPADVQEILNHLASINPELATAARKMAGRCQTPDEFVNKLLNALFKVCGEDGQQ